jgi:hypothetical protein
MCFEPLFGINYQGITGFETVTLGYSKSLNQAEPYDQATGSSIPAHSVGILYYKCAAATAWITDLISTSLTFEFDNGWRLNAVAIAATTAHTTLLSGSYPEIWEFYPVSEPITGRAVNYLGIPLIDFIYNSKDFRDPINQNLYSIPGDVMLFLILELSPSAIQLSAIKPAQNPLALNTPVSVFGYPFYASLDLIYPLNKLEPKSELEVKNAICGGSRLVKSEGIIKQTGEIHAISCTTAGGMSGSPVIIIENGLPCVAGILCGGPAAPLHRSFIDMIRKIQDSDWSSANLILHDLEGLPDLSLFVDRAMFDQMKTVLLARDAYCLDIILKIYNELLSRYVSHADISFVNHNLILPITSQAFSKAVYCSNRLANDRALQGMTLKHGEICKKLKDYYSP